MKQASRSNIVTCFISENIPVRKHAKEHEDAIIAVTFKLFVSSVLSSSNKTHDKCLLLYHSCSTAPFFQCDD